MLRTVQRILLLLLTTLLVFSCKKDKEETVEVVIVKPKVIDFGFNLNDFNVVHDTIQSGDTFGTILDKQNLGTLKVYDIVAQIKDTLNVRSIRVGKPFTF